MSDDREPTRPGLEPWAPGDQDRWVRIEVAELHGRAFARGPRR